MSESQQGPPIAVVTGSSSGIGQATAQRLAAEGYQVIVHAGNNRDAARDVANSLDLATGCQATVCMCDLAKTESLPEFVDACFDWQGRVDVWINNAGADVLTGQAAKWSFAEKLQQLMTVDVGASLRLSRDAGARMSQQPSRPGHHTSGLVINIGWDQSEHGMAGDSGQLFGASKGAIMAATRSLAQSLAPAVRVNCVAPGWIQTAWGQTASEDWQIRATQESLLGRWGQPSDVAGVVAFLAGPDGQFINGQVIAVNGGFRHGPGNIS